MVSLHGSHRGCTILHTGAESPHAYNRLRMPDPSSDSHLLPHPPNHSDADQPHLQRGFSLLHATALNISNVVGVGPFITIPLILAAMNGPQALLGWIVGALLAICDGC